MSKILLLYKLSVFSFNQIVSSTDFGRHQIATKPFGLI